ncbi:uncharacterized protein [Prorops nasuta]|uniref:uncharacterized protein n=1 Tax=Prorops nasuta TaxID=863751 RepID=UPI0034CE520A
MATKTTLRSYARSLTHRRLRRSSSFNRNNSNNPTPTRALTRTMPKHPISYTIEDLDAIEPAPLDGRRRRCSCDLLETAGTSPLDKPSHGDLRKAHSTEPEWVNTGARTLSPDDVIWDLKKHTGEGTEFRWVLHASNTDLELSKRVKCSCHSLTPAEDKSRQDSGQRGDLRKHHSAETDKWSLRPDSLTPPMHDLRKHLSDDSRMAGDSGARWTLQVPEVLPNPKPRCTCPKSKLPPPSPTPSDQGDKKDSRVTEVQIEVRTELTVEKTTTTTTLLHSRSLTSEEPLSRFGDGDKNELKRVLSEDPRPERPKERGRLERSAPIQKSVSISIGSKKWDTKDNVISPKESSKKSTVKSSWAMKPHFSLPVEKKESRWGRAHDSVDVPKTKSLKERQKYSIRRSMSPEPDPRQMTKLENRIVRRLISPEIKITDTKWAPYEDASPLPNIGIRRREQKHIGQIKWTPYDGSPSDASSCKLQDPEADTKPCSPFHNVTPTHHPPPEATPCRNDDEQDRWRFLNQVSPFPLYQGAWKDESPEKTPPRKFSTVEEIMATPVWLSRDSPSPQSPPMQYLQPVQSPRKSSISSRVSKKRVFGRVRSESHQLPDERFLAPPPFTITRASSEEPKSSRQRPQLARSKALLDVPIGPAKRSLSEEAPRKQRDHHPRGPIRTRSEEAPKYDDPWFEESFETESAELREYVTTV